MAHSVFIRQSAWEQLGCAHTHRAWPLATVPQATPGVFSFYHHGKARPIGKDAAQRIAVNIAKLPALFGSRKRRENGESRADHFCSRSMANCCTTGHALAPTTSASWGIAHRTLIASAKKVRFSLIIMPSRVVPLADLPSSRDNHRSAPA